MNKIILPFVAIIAAILMMEQAIVKGLYLSATLFLGFGVIGILILFGTILNDAFRDHIWLLSYDWQRGQNTGTGRTITRANTSDLNPSLIINAEYSILQNNDFNQVSINNAQYLGFHNYKRQVDDVIKKQKNI